MDIFQSVEDNDQEPMGIFQLMMMIRNYHLVFSSRLKRVILRLLLPWGLTCIALFTSRAILIITIIVTNNHHPHHACHIKAWPAASGGQYPFWFSSMFEFCQKMIHSIFDSILLYPRFNSNIIQFKKNLLIQFKRWFNSIVRESWMLVEKEKGPKIAQKVSKIDKKRGLFIKNSK